MTRSITLAILSLFISTGIALAATTLPAIPKTGKTIQDFVPKGWHLLAQTRGELNQDGKDDIVLALASDAESKPHKEKISRLLVILLQNQDGTFQRSAVSSKTLLCQSCGGFKGDPFEDIRIENGTVVVPHSGGSRDSWRSTHRFRYNNDSWDLVSKHTETVNTATNEKNVVDTNYETGESTEVKLKQDGKKLSQRIKFMPPPSSNISAYDISQDAMINQAGGFSP